MEFCIQNVALQAIIQGNVIARLVTLENSAMNVLMIITIVIIQVE